MQTVLAQIADSMAQLVGIPELSFDENDCICLEFDDTACTLVADIDADRLLLHTELARLSDFLDQAGICRALLGMNAELEFADGVAAMATDRDSDSIALCAVIRPLCAPQADLLEAIMIRFLELAADVQLRLKQLPTAPIAPQDFTGPGPGLRV